MALALPVLMYTADTATTSLVGATARQEDLNPLIRTLAPSTYGFSGFVRGILALGVLVWFWPGKLRFLNSKPRWLGRFIPFFYEHPQQYFGSALVMAATSLKAIAAWNNAQVLRGELPPLGPLAAILFGLASGIPYSNGVLFWHAKIKERGG